LGNDKEPKRCIVSRNYGESIPNAAQMLMRNTPNPMPLKKSPLFYPKPTNTCNACSRIKIPFLVYPILKMYNEYERKVGNVYERYEIPPPPKKAD
jgi:hypothetical protein